MDIKNTISQASGGLLAGYNGFTGNGAPESYPNPENIAQILRKIKMAIFPGCFNKASEIKLPDIWLEGLLASIQQELSAEIKTALLKQTDKENAAHLSEEISTGLIKQLPVIQQLLCKDAEAGFNGDPAARGVDEVILTYPGFFAVFAHRIAHFLFARNVPFIPRIMSEHAHSVTGIDIHPGAQIGEYFFIDHGTGVVIGETTVIGNHVKLYQGVTLGALSTKSGQKLAGKKRHPSIEDNVTIYSGASILGGETVVGENSTVGGNVFIIKSVPRDTTVKGIK